MREKIVRIVLIDQDPDKLISFICKGIEKVENPYGKRYTPVGCYHEGFESCRQKILALLR